MESCVCVPCILHFMEVLYGYDNSIKNMKCSLFSWPPEMDVVVQKLFLN